MKRKLSDEFMIALQEGGMLHPLLERIRKDDTLMLAIREDYINVYYRGGNIIKLEKETSPNRYAAFFDDNYAAEYPEYQELLPNDCHNQIKSKEDIELWIKSIPARKQAMDYWFHEHPKAEREFQQLVVRENNDSGISNETEYFVADIELADTEVGARFDILAFKWPAGDRKSGKVNLALIEMKYGDSAIKGQSGILEHLKQMHSYLIGKSKELADMAEKQINQLNQLGLIQHKKGAAREFTVVDSHFEIIFLFANHNPRSTILLEELARLKELLCGMENKMFELRFFVASTAGYAMHSACMMDIDQYMAFLKCENCHK
jgi:hypothetical protein